MSKTITKVQLGSTFIIKQSWPNQYFFINARRFQKVHHIIQILDEHSIRVVEGFRIEHFKWF